MISADSESFFDCERVFFWKGVPPTVASCGKCFLRSPLKNCAVSRSQCCTLKTTASSTSCSASERNGDGGEAL
jgi:hypothetical protein